MGSPALIGNLDFFAGAGTPGSGEVVGGRSGDGDLRVGDPGITDEVAGHPLMMTVSPVLSRLMLVVTNDGAELDVETVGEGPSLILIPGLASGAHAFEELRPLLSSSCRVITFDPRGIGRSRIGSAPYTIERLAGDVAEILLACDALPSAVFGLSMGGLVAQALALNHPTSVSRLVLGATACGAPLSVPPDPGVRDQLLGRGAKTPGEAYRMACQVLYSQHFNQTRPGFVDTEIAYRAQHPIRGKVFIAQESARRSFNSCERLAEIAAPTLVLHGAHDALVPQANAEDLAAKIRGATFQSFAQCGHLFFHEDPRGTADAVLDWIQT